MLIKWYFYIYLFIYLYWCRTLADWPLLNTLYFVRHGEWRTGHSPFPVRKLAAPLRGPPGTAVILMPAVLKLLWLPPHLSIFHQLCWLDAKRVHYSKSCVTQVLCSIYCCTTYTGLVQAGLLCGLHLAGWTHCDTVFFNFFLF